MKTIEIPRIQTTFPVTDLFEENARFIGLAFGNRDRVEMEHNTSEVKFPIFQETHPALMNCADTYYPYGGPRAEIDYGIMMFEALHSYVCSERNERKMLVRNNLSKLNSWVNESQNDRIVRDYLQFAPLEFQQDLPQAADAIREASARYFRQAEDYVIVGAAWARQIMQVHI